MLNEELRRICMIDRWVRSRMKDEGKISCLLQLIEID